MALRTQKEMRRRRTRTEEEGFFAPTKCVGAQNDKVKDGRHWGGRYRVTLARRRENAGVMPPLHLTVSK